MKRVLVCLLILFWPGTAFADPDPRYVGTLLGHNVFSQWAAHDPGTNHLWKSVRVQAITSGTATHFVVKMTAKSDGATPWIGDQSSKDVGWALYSGTSGYTDAIGSLIASGYEANHDFEADATAAGASNDFALSFPFDTPVAITSGSYYHLSLMIEDTDGSDSADKICFGRLGAESCSDSGCAPKWNAGTAGGVSQSDPEHPPGDGTGPYWGSQYDAGSRAYTWGIVDSSISHKGTLAITGTDFGSKSPAAPKLWDWCDATTTDDLSTYYSGQYYPDDDDDADCTNANAGETPYRTDYRSTFHGETSLPHDNVTKFICSAHTTCNGNWDEPNLSTRGNAVFTMEDWDSLMVFTMFYHRLNSGYSAEDSPDNDNYKELGANGINGSYLSTANGGAQSYLGACISPYIGYNDSDTAGIEDTDYYWGTTGSECGSSYRVYMPNPLGQWVHYEFEWDTTGRHATLSTGTRVSTTHGEAIWTERDFDNCINSIGTVPSISFGGYARGPRASATGNYRFWTAMYADDTWSRVMLGNNADWDSCTMREPQIPSSWTSTAIEVTVNQGAFSNGTAYLFVWDSSNDESPIGYPVTLGAAEGCASGCTITGGTVQ